MDPLNGVSHLWLLRCSEQKELAPLENRRKQQLISGRFGSVDQDKSRIDHDAYQMLFRSACSAKGRVSPPPLARRASEDLQTINSCKCLLKSAIGMSLLKQWKQLVQRPVRCTSAPKHWQKGNLIPCPLAFQKRLTASLL